MSLARCSWGKRSPISGLGLDWDICDGIWLPGIPLLPPFCFPQLAIGPTGGIPPPNVGRPQEDVGPSLAFVLDPFLKDIN